ncbi:hypothetical protein FB446DRAFT_124611 [Lentinula raphanica]|nr:hypothetical protein FB446DRAFT_124611 [Lentinula raphanica]
MHWLPWGSVRSVATLFQAFSSSICAACLRFALRLLPFASWIRRSIPIFISENAVLGADTGPHERISTDNRMVVNRLHLHCASWCMSNNAKEYLKNVWFMLSMTSKKEKKPHEILTLLSSLLSLNETEHASRACFLTTDRG